MRPEPDHDGLLGSPEVGAEARPLVLTDTGTYAVGTGAEDLTGAVWRLDRPGRDLDANVIALAPDDGIDRHRGPALDVLLHVLSGTGELRTAHETIALAPGALVWLPRGTEREFRAGATGLRYLTVHQRRHDALSITTRPDEAPVR